MAVKDQRTTPVKALVTSGEYKELQAAADRDGMSLSTWLRVIALRIAREKR